MNKKLSIQTPKGAIEAKTVENDDYPGIQLLLDGELVAVLEYDPLKKNAQVITYNKTSDEPRDIYLYEEETKNVLN